MGIRTLVFMTQSLFRKGSVLEILGFFPIERNAGREKLKKKWAE